MSTTPLVSSIVTSIADFDQLLTVAKRHGVTSLKLGDIELQIPGEVKKDPTEYQRSEQPDTNAINAIAYDTYRNL